MDIDAECAAALLRLAALADARFAQFREESKQRYFFTRRSISQKARRIREELLKGMK